MYSASDGKVALDFNDNHIYQGEYCSFLVNTFDLVEIKKKIKKSIMIYVRDLRRYDEIRSIVAVFAIACLFLEIIKNCFWRYFDYQEEGFSF